MGKTAYVRVNIDKINVSDIQFITDTLEGLGCDDFSIEIVQEPEPDKATQN